MYIYIYMYTYSYMYICLYVHIYICIYIHIFTYMAKASLTCRTPNNTQQHTRTQCTTLRHTATHCNTLQHTATHCNTLQQTGQRPLAHAAHATRHAPCDAHDRQCVRRQDFFGAARLNRQARTSPNHLHHVSGAVCSCVLQCAAVCYTV